MVLSIVKLWRSLRPIPRKFPERCAKFEGLWEPVTVRALPSWIGGQKSIWYCVSRTAAHQPSSGMSGEAEREKEPEFYTPLSVESGEQEALLLARPSAQPRGARVSKVAIIGTPNAGKSTLINSLLGRRICAVSQKVHTTRSKTLAVLTKRDTQVVLLDTPGMISFSAGRRHKLPRSLVVDAKNTLLEADLIAVLVDASNRWTNMKLDPEVLLQLHAHPDIPSILVLNKVDALQSKQSLFEITASLTEGTVDGKEIVSPRRRGRTGDRRRDSLPSTVIQESGEPDELGEENASSGHSSERTAGETVEGIPLVDSGRSHDAEGVPRVGDEDLHASRLHHHGPKDSAAGKLGDSVGLQETEDQVTGHVTSSRTALSGDLNPVKAGILQQYTDNLAEFVDSSNRDSSHSDATMDGNETNDSVVARQQETEKMEREREERRRLWRLAKERNGWPGFKAVYMISALHGDGVQELKDFLVSSAHPGDWEYHEDVVTNLTPEEIVREAIREKLLERLPQEVPYSITQTTDLWQRGENGEQVIVQTLICKKRSHLRMLEKKVGWIARHARQDLMDAFHCDVTLRLHLKISK